MKLAYNIIPVNLRSKYRSSVIFSLLNGILDLFSLGLLIPVIIAFVNPSEIDSGGFISKIYAFIGASSINSFQSTLLIGVTLLFIIKNVVSSLLSHYQNSTLFTIASTLSEHLYQQYYNQPYLEFTKGNSAFANRKINTIPHDFTVHILGSYMNLASELIIGGIIVVVIATYSPLLLVLVIATILPILLSWNIFRNKKLSQIESEFKQDYSENSKQLQKGIDSYIDAILHQKQSYFIEKFMSRKRKMNQNYALLKTAQQLPPKLLEIVLIVSIVVIFTYAMLFDLSNSIIPTLSLFMAAFYRLYPSVTKIITASTSLNSYGYVVDELVQLNTENRIEIREKIRFENHIEFKNVSFSYPNQESLISDFCLTINKGDCIGIVGKSGVGKSSLVKLLMGFIPPVTGNIAVDGHNLNVLDKGHWLHQIGYLQQQPVIIDGSILENIAFGEMKPDLQKVSHAIKQANLSDFIHELPNGLNTPLGENGLRISGGQIQRIALARALYKNSELFIFDEISNNLDEVNLKEIVSSIQQLHSSGKTVILIDHNPIILQMADKIWNLVVGEVTESNSIIHPI